MLRLFRKPKAQTTQSKVVDWLNDFGRKNGILNKDCELLAIYWSEPDFRSQKYFQVAMPTYFTEWIGRVDLVAHYETSNGLMPCSMFNTITLIAENTTPIAVHFRFSYVLEGLEYTRTITQELDVQPLIDAAIESDFNKQKAATTLYYLSAAFAAKMARHQFLIERRKRQLVEL